MKVKSVVLLLSIFTFSVTSRAEIEQSVLYFAQLAIGGGATTTFVVHNPTDQEIKVTLELYDSGGEPISSQNIRLSSDGTQTMVVGGSTGKMKVGWQNSHPIRFLLRQSFLKSRLEIKFFQG